jgi:hypothetical protein
MKVLPPPPSIVLLSAITGVIPLLQHTPRSTMVPEPSSVIQPPLVAVVAVILVTDAVFKAVLFLSCRNEECSQESGY